MRTLSAGSDPEVDFREHKVFGLIDQFEKCAFVDLVGGNRFADFGAVKMGALHFGAEQEALRLFSEQKNGRMGRASVVEQVEMREHVLRRRVLWERKIAPAASLHEKPRDFVEIQIAEGRVSAVARIKGRKTDQFVRFQHFDQTRVYGRDQFLAGVEAAADEFAACRADEVHHFGMPGVVGVPLNENQTFLAGCRRRIEFPMGWRKTVGVLPAVLISEQGQINVAPRDFVQIDLVGSSV